MDLATIGARRTVAFGQDASHPNPAFALANPAVEASCRAAVQDARPSAQLEAERHWAETTPISLKVAGRCADILRRNADGFWKRNQLRHYFGIPEDRYKDGDECEMNKYRLIYGKGTTQSLAASVAAERYGYTVIAGDHNSDRLMLDLNYKNIGETVVRIKHKPQVTAPYKTVERHSLKNAPKEIQAAALFALFDATKISFDLATRRGRYNLRPRFMKEIGDYNFGP